MKKIVIVGAGGRGSLTSTARPGWRDRGWMRVGCGRGI